MSQDPISQDYDKAVWFDNLAVLNLGEFGMELWGSGLTFEALPVTHETS